MGADQAKVLQTYPLAGCYHVRGIPGAGKPGDKDHWCVYRDPKDISYTIGIGATEAEAWADAAKMTINTEMKRR